jgi:glycosyltransferase involved in cell wall biosynthesis
LGGAEASLLDVFASLRDAEPQWTLRLVTSSDGPLVARAEAMGVETTVLPFPSALARLGDHAAALPSRGGLLPSLLAALPGVASYVRQLRGLLREISPDVVHSNGLKMHILGVWTRPAGVPVIWHVREYVSSRPAMSRLLRWHASRCAAAVAISRTVAEDLRAVCGSRIDVRLVYNAIDTETFVPTGPVADLDALSSLPAPEAGTVRVGLPATLATWKGQEVFLRALAALPPRPPVRGYIVGGEVYEPEGSQASLRELRTMATQLGIGEEVGFTGFVREPAAAMRALDIVVHASTRPEPFGRVIVEAMACGRAVVASEAGGAAEIIEAGDNALGHTPGDAGMLAQKIEQLVNDPGLRQRLGAAGRATAERRFDRARLATDLVPIYRSLVARA